MCSANESQAKALESIQLLACKYILGCSATCDEPVLADLGLETLKYRRNFCNYITWYFKVKCMNDERLRSQMSGAR